MSRGKYEERVIVRPKSILPKVWTVCLGTIWIFIIGMYIVNVFIYQRYGYDMSFGMIVFVYPAIILTILFIIYKIFSRLRPRIDVILKIEKGEPIGLNLELY